ncbi:MAG: hypothetical protein HYX90_07150 [Chloroflexi bacterium]|nr:hypothetical protein [Chloroflexota bacterium]
MALAEGVAELCSAIVPHPMGMLSPAEIEAKADKAFPEIMRLATEWNSKGSRSVAKLAYPAERFEFDGKAEDVSNHFFDQGWSLGLPIIPPTPDRVEAMLRGTTRRPDEVLGRMPPRMASLTVELVAAHAVMAGCKPKYMPILIAAIEGLLDPKIDARGALSTTGTTQFVAIVNGPIVKDAGIASRQGSAGKGHRANATIGYAINLIAYNVGGSRPPDVDKSTFGSPADFTCWVFGENEEQVPVNWQPLHVERGFKESDSVVTVLYSYPPLDNIDHWSVTPEEHVRWWSRLISPLDNMGGPCWPNALDLEPVVALGPEHAALIASAGWSKDDFRKALWERARIPLSTWPAGSPAMRALVEKLGQLAPDSMVPITADPAKFVIAIGGGAGKQSHFFPSFPWCFTVSKLIRR